MAKTTLASSLALTATLALGVVAAAPALGQAPPTPPPPAVVSKDPAAAPAGTYNIDLAHSSVIARVAHGGGVSFSTLRFGVTKAVLTWDPANPANIKLEATVDTKPHYDPIVYRLPPEAPQLLNAAQFPQATFTSTAVRRTGPNRADVDGNLTLLGVTKPAVLHMELVGVTKNQQGATIVGFTGSMEVKRADFGLTAAPNAIGANVSLTLDGEFVKAGA